MVAGKANPPQVNGLIVKLFERVAHSDISSTFLYLHESKWKDWLNDYITGSADEGHDTAEVALNLMQVFLRGDALNNEQRYIYILVYLFLSSISLLDMICNMILLLLLLYDILFTLFYRHSSSLLTDIGLPLGKDLEQNPTK